MRRVDYIIVGLGLAGATLAMELLKRKKRLCVFDLPGENRASAIAAGLFNPITGKTMVLTWKADQVFPLLHEWYRGVESILGEQFFFPQPVYRPFVSAGEQNEWMGKSADSAFGDYLQNVQTIPHNPSQVINPFGGLLLRQCGYVNTTDFLNAVRALLISTGQYDSSRFNYESLAVEGDLLYKDLAADKIIFCEGAHVKSNPFFSWLPIRPLGGEVLEIELNEQPDFLYNRHVYVVPTSERRFKVGATYVNKDITGISAEGRQELTERLDELLCLDYRIVHQDWGIRPVVRDRKPILGAHPNHANLVVLNGLGTKGVSLAPYCASRLCGWLEDGLDLDPDTNIERFKSLYSKF